MKAFKLPLASLALAVSLISSCSAPAINQAAVRPNPLQAQNAAAQAESRYVITAQALIDKIATVKDPALQQKIKTDFLPHIKSLNRYAINNLIKYAVKVLQAHLEPGQIANQHPVASLIYPLLERSLDIYMPFADRAFEMVSIATADTPAEQEALIAQFTNNLRRLPKADLKQLLAMIDQNDDNLFPADSRLTQRLIRIIQDVLLR